MAWKNCPTCNRPFNDAKGGCKNSACKSYDSSSGPASPVSGFTGGPSSGVGMKPTVGPALPKIGALPAAQSGPGPTVAIAQPFTPSSGGEIKVVHRADGRNLDHPSITRDKGFACQNGQWVIRETACARAFIKKVLDPSYDVSRVPGFAFAAEILTPGTGKFAKKIKLNDVMASIKRVLKDTRAFWVSTSLNKECGGYASNMDYSVYRFTLPYALNQYELVLGDPVNSLKKVTARSSDLIPTICFDGRLPDGSDSNLVAINSGPVNDAEISFLTRIKIEWVETLRAKTNKTA